MSEEDFIPCENCGDNVLKKVEVDLSYKGTQMRNNIGKIKHVEKENGETEVIAYCKDCWERPKKKKGGYRTVEEFKRSLKGKDKNKKTTTIPELKEERQNNSPNTQIEKTVESVVKKTLGK